MAEAAITNLRDSTSLDAAGAVRSVQAADLLVREETLRGIWSPAYLERLARTYWRFLPRVTLGLVRVYYTESERFVVLLIKPLRLLTFAAPEYELEPDHGVVRWRVKRGLLVARAGHEGEGHLQIDVRRMDGLGTPPAPEGTPPAPEGTPPAPEGTPPAPEGTLLTSEGIQPAPQSTAPAPEQPVPVRLHIEVEVANFYPAIAHGIGRWAYNVTQSRIHVLVTNGFLRSLARLDLATSRVGRLAELGPGGTARDGSPADPAAWENGPARIGQRGISRSARRRRWPAAWRGRGGR